MPKRKAALIILIFLITIFLLLLFIIKANQKELRVIFFNVGQGDSALIIQGNRQILIDGGSEGKILLEKLGKFIPFWDRKVEVVIATHPDKDHIGGLLEAFESYKIGILIKSKIEKDSSIYQALEALADQEKISKLEGGQEMKISWPGEVNLKILKAKKGNSNQSSLVSRLDFGENSFLFTGDIEKEEEKELMASFPDLLTVDFLKVSHHGSKYSTSAEFLKKVQPRGAIISVSAKNRYGHPAEEVLQRLAEAKAEVLRTDREGDIIFRCLDAESKCFRAQ
jgi:competence protein ComEC